MGQETWAHVRAIFRHAAIETDGMRNIYSGNAVLDASGQAVVELPDWFEALNRNFQYHLTPVGAPAPDLHVAGEIAENRFHIAGGPAGLKVSWQVIGERQDRFALEHPLQVEVRK